MSVGRTVVETPVAEKIAALTALATPGVIRLEPSISALAASLGRRALGGPGSWRGTGNGALPPTAGVRAEITDDQVTVEVALAVELGRSVPVVAADAQQRIADALRELGSFTVESVTILVVDVDQP
ncbi:MAG TPA: Asp23/Gls24 family envelope stress response protein [Streptosporangiaceae bacterium]|jgi:uncharacterized alkaline shock family protein YloU|nr:Asp23/Gls24 family envelope stress response protein [Streptosporangiaceae bacterium]